jgi:DNA-binding MarR family transcriptional regulator/GNAT superfamily N-acetyltransferase
MTDAELVQARRYFELVAGRLSALEQAGARRPPGESRLLSEIGPAGCPVRSLRSRLGLDSGYVSRLLRRLQVAGLVTVGPDPLDRRRRTVRPTKAGRAEQQALERRAVRAMATLLEPLDASQQERLRRALIEVAHLVVLPAVRLEAVHPAAAPARWCLQRYVEELDRRLPGGFDTARARPVDLVPPAGVVVLARLWDQPVGCGGLRMHRDCTGEIKRMWVAPEVRGLGVGRLLLGELEGRATAAGAGAVRLDTHSALTEAVALYRRSGYRPVSPFNDEVHADLWFEKALAPPEPDGMVGSVRRSQGRLA